MPQPFKALLSIPTLFACLCLLAMMFLIVFDVIGKFVFNHPIPGATEIVAYYFMVGCVFLPLPYIEAACRSIIVETIFDWLPHGMKVVLEIFSCVLTVAFYLILVREYWIVAVDSMEINEYVSGAWDVVIWPSKFTIPLSLAIAIVILGLRMFDLASGKLMPNGSMVDEHNVAEEEKQGDYV